MTQLREGIAGAPVEWAIGPASPYPEATLHDLVWRRAAAHPDAVAVRQWGQRLTYGALSRGAGRVAVALRAAGVGPETRVAVCVSRRPHLVTALLGVLSAGGAYVPIDPDQPAHRRDMIIADAGATVAVVDKVGRDALADTRLVLIDVPEDDPPECPEAGALTLGASSVGALTAVPDNAAYVLFTSGSTGRPKGVLVSHRGAVAFCTATGRSCGVDARTRGIGFAALSFDVSVLDIFTVLLRGGTVCLVPEDDRADAGRLQAFLTEHEVTWGYLAPALLPLLDPAALAHLRCVIVGGEATRPEQVARWSAGGRVFLNWYGPTEATVSVTGSRLRGDWTRPLPIGAALPNHRCYVLDADLRPVGPGEAGELCVAGVGLARGYVGQPGQTAERFVPDPFADEPGARMYRTGDLVRWGDDGRLDFLGRLDGQVKVRGQRVEVGEVEAALAAHPAVAQAAVDLRVGPSGEGELVAYLTPASAPKPDEIRRYAASRLPAYMVPGRYVYLDALPLTLSSKVDLARLRALAAAPARPPRPATEWSTDIGRAVADAWARVLGDEVAAADDDFVGHGGTSLAAMRLAGMLRTESGREVSVADVFRAGTLGALVSAVEMAPPVAAVPPAAARPTRALTAAQRRLWFIDRLTGHTPAYHIAIAERLRGPLDVTALADALADVARRHEALRWRLPDRDGVPFVVVAPAGPVPASDDLSGAADPEAELRRRLDEEARRPMDLATGPLWRVRLLRLGDGDHVLAITVHHIVFDAWSLRVLQRDLGTAYAARLPGGPGTLPAGWLDGPVPPPATTIEQGAGELEWWLDRLRGAPTTMELPADRARPPVAAHHGAAARRSMPAGVSEAVARTATALRATPYAVTLAAFAVLLRRLTGATDLIVGVPVADRGGGTDEVVGFYIDTVPLRLTVDDAGSFAAHVRAAHEAVVDALAHRAVPFERLVERLRVPRDLSRNPLVQVLFNAYELTDARPSLPGIEATELPAGLPGALFDLTLYVIDRESGTDVEAVYDPDLYDAARVDALLASYLTLLGSLTGAPDTPVGAASARPPGRSPLPDLRVPLGPQAADPGSLGDAIRSAATADPDAVALTGGGRALSYREFGALADAVRDGIGRRGAGHRDTVAVVATRCVELPAVLLGVLNSGARWLIIDPALPAAQSARQLEAAGARLAVLCPGATAEPAWPTMPVVGLHELRAAGVHGGTEGLVPVGGDRGYHMVTSGTTGEPLVVDVAEAPLVRFLRWYATEFGLRPGDATALLGGLAHDPLLRDAFAPLTAGGRVCVPDAAWLRDPATLARWLAAERVTILHLTPALGRMLAAADALLPDVRLVVLGGDRLTGADVTAARSYAPRAVLVNAYGTTETPQIQSLYPILDGDAGRAHIPVGHGIGGCQLHVLPAGRAGRMAAVGEIGEVAIRGRDLALGYTDATQTEARFATVDGSDRMFHTGDLGRYDADGNVVLAGRADSQVKIRGHRVELGEVEAALAGHPDVAQAAATVHAPGGEAQIVAYAVPTKSGVAAATLRDHLASLLPEHARPADVILLASLPLTRNGKVDRAALPAPATRHAPVAHSEPATPTERMLAAVWREVLGLPRVSATANFFEIGGHSLAIVAVQARVRAATGRQVEIVDLFRFPNVRSLAAHLDHGDRAPGLDRADRRVAAQRQRGAARRQRRSPHPARPTQPNLNDEEQRHA